MSVANSQTSYGGMARAFHWLTALLILTIIPLGVIANGLPYDTSEELARKALLFSMHKTLGVTIFFVALARILWAVSQPKPAPLHPERRLELWAAETVHWLLYGSLLLVPLTGWIHHAATTGFAPIWWPFGQSLPLVPKDEAWATLFAGLHKVLERVLVFALLLHIAGALKHHFIDRDATLARMIRGTEAGAPAPHKKNSLPLVSALTVWAVAIGIGGALGSYAGHDAPRPSVALSEVATDWTVQDGEIAISVRQLGSAVEGRFNDWTAAIRFDPEVTDGPAGDVDVTIAIPSLTLGAVTNQAMTPDYFHAEAHPTARFTGDLIASVNGYWAEGFLTLRGVERPIGFEFTLTPVEEALRMTADLTLDRRDFGIGAGMTDEASLGFEVQVRLAVTAARAE